MTRHLLNDGDDLSTDGLTDRFNIDDDAIPDSNDPTEIALNIGFALVLVDELMGDDPVKFEAQQALVKAFAAVDGQHPDNTRTTLQYGDGEITIDVSTPEE